MALTDRRPTGLLKALLRAPVMLFRARLGWVFGYRLVYIAHRGRRTGKRREVVAEVVHYDRATPEVVVIAAWGENPDWYRNLQAAPPIEVRLAAQRWRTVQCRFPGGGETVQTLRHYRDAHPGAWRRLAPLLGFPADPADPRWCDVAGTVRAVALRPTD
jgi:deazaflavin-dependent oxidoreductase (nitroreductase family)